MITQILSKEVRLDIIDEIMTMITLLRNSAHRCISINPCYDPHSTAGAYVCVYSYTPSFNLNKTRTVNNL